MENRDRTQNQGGQSQGGKPNQGGGQKAVVRKAAAARRAEVPPRAVCQTKVGERKVNRADKTTPDVRPRADLDTRADARAKPVFRTLTIRTIASLQSASAAPPTSKLGQTTKHATLPEFYRLIRDGHHEVAFFWADADDRWNLAC